MMISMFLQCIALMLAARADGTTRANDEGLPVCVPGTVVKVCQLTGDFDRQRQEETLNLTGRFDVRGVDLGYPVEHRGRLYFLWGDAHGTAWRRDRCPIAYTTGRDPEHLALEFLLDPDGGFHPITIPGISQRGFEVPSGGISIGDTLYIVYTTDHSKTHVMGRSVLAKSDDDGYTFVKLYDLSDRDENGRFINAAMVEVESGQVAGLPASADTVLIWGSGAYRRSSPYLACVPSAGIEAKSAIRYFAGLDQAGHPTWSESEVDAMSLFNHPQIGEFSVVWHDELRCWLMLYNSLSPRGILLRCARKPWGPWSDAQTLLDPMRDAYGKFMHSLKNPLPEGVSLSDPGRQKVWGGEYAPYLTKRFFRSAAGRHTIYFLMSTWNPYQVVLMRAEIRSP